ncbi:MAG: 3-phosphoshikimate 1-carboxyvinyltransferase [Eubacteriales bacterium]
MKFNKINGLSGTVSIPGDKSISHRSIMFGALSKGLTEVTNFLPGADCISTINCFRKLGIQIEHKGTNVSIHGLGLHGLQAPSSMLDAGNSGTTTRLISGILVAQPFTTTLTGDESIQTRPMKRIIDPLSSMGASIESIHGNGCAPLRIVGGPLQSIHHVSKVASAQVKSAILLAGLYADGDTSVTEPAISRNHSEIMLNFFGANVTTVGTTATITPNPYLEGRKLAVPGDISSAAYFIAAGLIVPNSEIVLTNVGINPTRDGIIRVAKAMGGDISLLNESRDQGEPTADLLIRSSSLHGITIEGDIIPTLIDELPIIAIMAAFAKGQTIIKDAAELKVKESNRIDVMVDNLSAMGGDITGTDDGMIINGDVPLHGAVIDSKLDHRIAMSFAIAGLQADGETEITGFDCVTISYPNFYQDLEKLFIN